MVLARPAEALERLAERRSAKFAEAPTELPAPHLVQGTYGVCLIEVQAGGEANPERNAFGVSLERAWEHPAAYDKVRTGRGDPSTTVAKGRTSHRTRFGQGGANRHPGLRAPELENSVGACCCQHRSVAPKNKPRDRRAMCKRLTNRSAIRRVPKAACSVRAGRRE